MISLTELVADVGEESIPRVSFSRDKRFEGAVLFALPESGDNDFSL